MSKVTLTDLAMIKFEEVATMCRNMNMTKMPANFITHALPAEGLRMKHSYRAEAVKRGIVKDYVKTAKGTRNFIL